MHMQLEKTEARRIFQMQPTFTFNTFRQFIYLFMNNTSMI